MKIHHKRSVKSQAVRTNRFPSFGGGGGGKGVEPKSNSLHYRYTARVEVVMGLY